MRGPSSSAALSVLFLAYIDSALAAVAVGSSSYAVVPGSGTIATDVPAAYTSGKRPATASEWPAIKAAGGATLASGLSANGNQAVIWDDSNGNFALVDLANPDAALVAVQPTDTNPGLLVLENAAKTCPSTSSSPVNVIDSYPGVTLTDTLVDSCLCFSQYSGPTCATFTTAANCPNATVAAMTANTGQQVIKDGINGGAINPLQETVEFQIDSPQVATRNYTYFEWGSCKNGANNNSPVLRKFNSATDATSCNDGFQFGYLVAGLRDVCGLQQGNFQYDGTKEGRANNSWVRYRGDLNIYYSEIVSLSLNGGANSQQLTRTGRLVTPIDVYILRLAAAELNTTTSINVVSPFQLKAAVTATNVKANQTTATVDITFGISNPYEIKYISNEYPGDGGITVPGVKWVSNGVPDIAGAYVVDANGNVVAGSQVNQSSNAGLAPCAANDFDANGFCWRTVRVLIITDTACTLDHTFTFNTIAVGCNAQYSGNDCPLAGGTDTTSQASFTVRAADYCDGQRALVINGAIVIKAYVPQRTLSRTDLNMMRSYTINQQAWLTLFIDADRSLKVFGFTPIAFESKIGENSAYTVPKLASQYITASSSATPGWGGVNQGFDVATQTHAMAVTLDCDFVMDASGTQCLLAPGAPGNPASQEILTRLTFLVDYEPAQGAGRRRRRQAMGEMGGDAGGAADTPIGGDAAGDAAGALPPPAETGPLEPQRGYAAAMLKLGIVSDVALAEENPSAASAVAVSSWLSLAVALALAALIG